MEKTFVLALIGAHFMMAIGLPEISMDNATSKFDWHRQRDSSDSTTSKCIYQRGFFNGDFTYIGQFKDEMCIVACTDQKKIDPRINGAISRTSGEGCWCAENTHDIIDNAGFKSCVLEPDDNKLRRVRCGPKNSGAGCNPNSIHPCCAPSGWCGNTKEYCSCVGCVDYRIKEEKDTTTTTTTTTSATTTTPPPAIDKLKSCGHHDALSCADCPQGHGRSWCNGECEWLNGQCVDKDKLKSCGHHYALSCADCLQGNGRSWCNGECEWLNGQCVDKDKLKSCGHHDALSCADCPQGHGRSWCNGECEWLNGQCVDKGTKWRSDLRCGPKFSGAECNPSSTHTCCDPYGWCINAKLHCSCVGCVDYRIKEEKVTKWRSDHKCGPKYSGAECNPNGIYPCCSDRGWCGNTKQHCSCIGCVDYRIKKAGFNYRKDPRSSFRKYHLRSIFRKDHHTDEGIRELI